ncbi:MAG TPA: DUF58 domain-containing protein [Rhodanobacteraceae bacterium]|nr:DUF58 domain-containing protein [Rhodanobacteraceae bacterium]
MDRTGSQRMRVEAVTTRDVQGRARVTLEELLALRYQVPRLGSTARARTSGAGTHLSHLHARGVDYAESRVYQPGDDIRAMDWRVTARTGKPHTKLFQEERERSLIVLVDGNASMRFGSRTRFKSVQACRAAALAAWMGVRGGDRVGGMVFGRLAASVNPRGGARGALALIGALARWDAAPEGDEEPLSIALKRCLRLAPPGSRVVLMSDGFSADDAAQPLLARLRQRVELSALIVSDALECSPPPTGSYSVENAGKRHALVLQSRVARNAFAAELARGHRALEALCRRTATPAWRLETGDDPALALRQLLDKPGTFRC